MMGDNNSGNSPDLIINYIYSTVEIYILGWLNPIPLYYLHSQQQHLPIYVTSSY